MIAADIGLALAALAVAWWLRPWRGLAAHGPPWSWLAIWAVLPLLWGLDRYTEVAVARPLSGAVLLMLFAGWPLTVIAVVPVALVTAIAGHVDWAESAHRLAWLGVVPASFALGIGTLLRRWLPNHLFVYILGRGFLGTGLACLLASGTEIALRAPAGGTVTADLAIAAVLNAFAEAFITGMLVAIAVAYRPDWLATYSDRLYLPARPPP